MRGASIIVLFVSSTVKQAGMSQYCYRQGEVHSVTKQLDKRYGLFGFMAIKDEDIRIHSPNIESTLCIKNAVRRLHANNHLYSTFSWKVWNMKADCVNHSLL